MNKTCARCQKVVYPIEELKCLDKTWHKTCFRCSECGMMLNMKTYKGYNKLPYCEAHIPKAKATAIADTPELKRIAENTKIQSNVKYHADFEKAKGKFTQVADDPETLRIKQNTKHISNVAYHGDLEKKAAMEKQREAAEVADSRGATSSPSSSQHHHSNQQQQNLASYQGNVPTAATISAQVQQSTPNSYNQLRSSILQNSHHPTGAAIIDSAVGPTSPSSVVSPYSAYDQYDNYARPAATYNNNNSNINNNHAVYQQQQQLQQQQQQLQQQQLQQKPYQQQQQQPNQPTAAQQLYASNTFGNLHQSGTSLAAGSTASTTSNTASHHSNGSGSGIIQNGSGGNSGANISANNIGKIADYDPLTDGPRQIPNTSRPATTLIYSSESRGSVNSAYPKRVGSIADIDPANGIYGSIAGDNLSAHSIHHQQSQQQQQQQYYQQMQLMQQQQQQQQQALQQHDQQLRQQQSQQQLHQTQSKPSLRIYRALYDYVAQDVDEVSFREGDVIFEVDSIDSGWMTGRVERTGKTGMLPANYVEHAVI